MNATKTHEVTIPAARPAARRWRRWGARLAAALVMMALVGAVIQAVAERRDRATHVAPGDLVELEDGRRMHLHVTGREHDGPTVVLEAGMGGFSPAWAWIQPAISEHATVVSYDRPGLGWSDPSDTAPTAAAVVDDLSEALRAAGLDGPYVLVGHSLGGLYVRAFAAAHPELVAGIVLVDPSHEEQHLHLDGYADDMAQGGRMMAALQAAAQVGLTRIYDPLAPFIADLPEPQLSQALAAQVTPRYFGAYRAEMAAMTAVADHVGSLDRELGEVPLRIVAAGGSPDPSMQAMVDTLNELRFDLLRLSTDADYHLLPVAEHVTLVTKQEYAAEVSRIITDLLRDMRNS